MESAHYFINECETLAAQAAEKGNSAVGAIIVKDGEIISRAEEAVKTKNDITCHAEMEAIRMAVKKLKTNDLSSFTLYTTHEPCVMCSYAIRFHKIKQVVYLHQSTYLGGITSSFPLLTTDRVPPGWSNPPVVTQYKESSEPTEK